MGVVCADAHKIAWLLNVVDLSMVIISTGTQVPLQSGRSLTASGQVVDVTA